MGPGQRVSGYGSRLEAYSTLVSGCGARASREKRPSGVGCDGGLESPCPDVGLELVLRRLLVAKGVDGVDVGGFDRGVGAEDDADDGAHSEAVDHPVDGEDDG